MTSEGPRSLQEIRDTLRTYRMNQESPYATGETRDYVADVDWLLEYIDGLNQQLGDSWELCDRGVERNAWLGRGVASRDKLFREIRSALDEPDPLASIRALAAAHGELKEQERLHLKKRADATAAEAKAKAEEPWPPEGHVHVWRDFRGIDGTHTKCLTCGTVGAGGPDAAL
jgi:hypothetical protein